MGFVDEYEKNIEERMQFNVPPLPLNAKQTSELIENLKNGEGDQERLLYLLENRVPPGVDEAAYVKANFLDALVKGEISCKVIDKIKAIKILGTMLGGYNVAPLVNALQLDTDVAKEACEVLKKIILVYEAFNDIEELARTNPYAKEILVSWANAEWFTSKKELPKKITVAVLKVPGETNTDDLSPASEAFTRSDIPLHAQSMLVKRLEGSIEKINEFKEKGLEVAYVGDVVGTGSSRKSGINSVQWHMGRDIPFVPNKKTGGVVLGSTIAPIFFNTAQDSGALPIEVNVDVFETGDIIDIYPFEGKIEKDGKVVAEFSLSPNTIVDEYRAGGRIPLIIGRGLTAKARESLKMEPEKIFLKPIQPASDKLKGYTQAQKIVGAACGMEGVRPGMYIEPMTVTVGSQDTTGPMTRDEVVELAALGFSADFVLQSFCHTAAYPKPSDVKTHATLPRFFTSRTGVSLKPGDGVIHSWLNRMTLPDTVGTGGDSHTRFPIGISFPAGSGLVAFAGVTGSMPLNMPESVLVRFSGKLRPGITLRDLVNAIPYFAIKQGHLTVPKKNKKNIFAGKVLEIEGLPDLKAEQAFELSDASAERSAAACCIALSQEPVKEYLRSNIALINAMIKNGYEDRKTLERRAKKMQDWLDNPQLLKADSNAEYSAVIEINLDEVTEPILACPNDPDDVATLSEILADSDRLHSIDEVFVGSCMTNIGHYRALGEILKGEGQIKTKLWIAPPTMMDKQQLTDEGYYSIFGTSGARIEIPGCSLCMGNQARVANGATVFSTSTRNFDNRMGVGAQVYLGSAELAGVCAILGKIPTAKEYLDIVIPKIEGKEADVYKYLNFHLISDYELMN